MSRSIAGTPAAALVLSLVMPGGCGGPGDEPATSSGGPSASEESSGAGDDAATEAPDGCGLKQAEQLLALADSNL